MYTVYIWFWPTLTIGNYNAEAWVPVDMGTYVSV